MRKLLFSITVAAAALAAAPAAAQSGYGDRDRDRGYGYNQGQGRGLEQQLANLESRIRMAAERRIISRQEAFRLQRQANQIEWQYNRYRRNGLTQWEYRDIQNRIEGLRRQLRWDRNDRNDRNWGDRNDRDDRYDRRDRDRNDDDHDDDDDD